MTVTTARVLNAFLKNPGKPQYGFDLMEELGLASGSLYPILKRLERAGWIVGQKEEIDPSQAGRPARRNYLLTGEGARLARLELAAMSAAVQPPPIKLSGLRPQGGHS